MASIHETLGASRKGVTTLVAADPPRRPLWRRWGPPALVAAAFAVLAAVVWLAWQDGLAGGGEPPLVRAPAGPIKHPPDKPGVDEPAERRNGATRLVEGPAPPPKVERLLPREPAAPRSLAEADPELAAQPPAPGPTGGLGASAAAATRPPAAAPATASAAPSPAATPSALAAPEPARPALSAWPVQAPLAQPPTARPPAAQSPPAPLPAAEPPAAVAAIPPPEPVRAMPGPPASATAASPPVAAPPVPAARAPASPAPAPLAQSPAAPSLGARSPGARVPTAQPPAATAARPPAPDQLAAREPAPGRASAPPSAPRGPWAVQVAAVSSREAAERGWTALQARHPDLLGPLQLRVEEARLANGLTLYRLQGLGFADRDAAAQTCARLKAAGNECFVVGVR